MTGVPCAMLAGAAWWRFDDGSGKTLGHGGESGAVSGASMMIYLAHLHRFD